MANAAASGAGVELAPSIVVAHLELETPLVIYLMSYLEVLAAVETWVMASVPTKANAAANGAGAAPTQSIVVTHLEVIHPGDSFHSVAMETWVTASVLILWNAAANGAGAEPTQSTALKDSIGSNRL